MRRLLREGMVFSHMQEKFVLDETPKIDDVIVRIYYPDLGMMTYKRIATCDEWIPRSPIIVIEPQTEVSD